MGASAADIVAAYGIDHALASRIVAVSRALGIPDAAMLANVINFESNGFNPQARNPFSGATGLIQFMPSTAAELGTSTSALRSMSAVRQMRYVQRYFELPRITKYGPLRTQLDVYMAVFYPKAIGKGPGYRFSPRVQAVNPGIRTAGDYERKANRRARLTPAAVAGFAVGAALLGAAVGGGILWVVLRRRRSRALPAG